LGAVSTMAPLKPRQTFLFGEPPVETPPQYAQRQRPATPSGSSTESMRCSTPLASSTTLDLRDRETLHLCCCGCRGTRNSQLQTIVAALQPSARALHEAAYLPSQTRARLSPESPPRCSRGLRLPVLPWVLCWAILRYWAGRIKLWTHCMRIQLCRGHARLYSPIGGVRLVEADAGTRPIHPDAAWQQPAAAGMASGPRRICHV
jgi:hypothetical protein